MFDAAVTQTGGAGDTGTLTLSGDLTLSHAGQIKDALLEVVSRFKTIIVRVEELENIDFSCLQLFCSAYRTAGAQRKSLVVVPPVNETARFILALEHAGLSPKAGASEDEIQTRGFPVKEI
jgi:anti-anti-sigma factor